MNLARHRRRRLLAAVLAFVLALSQVVVAAYACPIEDGRKATSFADMRDAEPMPDCDAMATHTDSAANVCETHCLVGQHMQGDNVLFAAVAVLRPLVVRALPTLREALSAFVDAEAPLPTPPPLLRFTRLLI